MSVDNNCLTDQSQESRLQGQGDNSSSRMASDVYDKNLTSLCAGDKPDTSASNHLPEVSFVDSSKPAATATVGDTSLAGGAQTNKGGDQTLTGGAQTNKGGDQTLTGGAQTMNGGDQTITVSPNINVTVDVPAQSPASGTSAPGGDLTALTQFESSQMQQLTNFETNMMTNLTNFENNALATLSGHSASGNNYLDGWLNPGGGGFPPVVEVPVPIAYAGGPSNSGFNPLDPLGLFGDSSSGGSNSSGFNPLDPLGLIGDVTGGSQGSNSGHSSGFNPLDPLGLVGDVTGGSHGSNSGHSGGFNPLDPLGVVGDITGGSHGSNPIANLPTPPNPLNLLAGNSNNSGGGFNILDPLGIF